MLDECADGGVTVGHCSARIARTYPESKKGTGKEKGEPLAPPQLVDTGKAISVYAAAGIIRRTLARIDELAGFSVKSLGTTGVA